MSPAQRGQRYFPIQRANLPKSSFFLLYHSATRKRDYLNSARIFKADSVGNEIESADELTDCRVAYSLAIFY
jgi:hypothetical protein